LALAAIPAEIPGELPDKFLENRLPAIKGIAIQTIFTLEQGKLIRVHRQM